MSTKYKTSEKCERSWGWWEVLDSQDSYVVKRFCVMPGQKISLQTHEHRSEHWIIAKGTAKITLAKSTFVRTQNEAIFIPTGEFHQIENVGAEELVIIEIQAGDILDEQDITRYNPDYTPKEKY